MWAEQRVGVRCIVWLGLGRSFGSAFWRQEYAFSCRIDDDVPLISGVYVVKVYSRYPDIDRLVGLNVWIVFAPFDGRHRPLKLLSEVFRQEIFQTIVGYVALEQVVDHDGIIRSADIGPVVERDKKM